MGLPAGNYVIAVSNSDLELNGEFETSYLIPKQKSNYRQFKKNNFMKKFFNSKVLLVIALAMFSISANAQLVYESTGLRLNGPRYQNYTSTWNGGAHAWRLDRGGTPHVFRLIMDTYYSFGAQISSNRGAIYFFDDETWSYNNVFARSFFTASDANLKTNVTPFSNATKSVLALRPVTYNWREQQGRSVASRKDIGFIAQEVERVLPDIVAEDHVGNKVVDYSGLIPILTGAIQELNARIEALEKQLSAQ
jgi:hypothetical protein